MAYKGGMLLESHTGVNSVTMALEDNSTGSCWIPGSWIYNVVRPDFYVPYPPCSRYFSRALGMS
jgi:hypothetical protein